MTVSKRKDSSGWMFDSVVSGKRIRKTFKTEGEAKKFEATVNLSMLSGVPIDPARGEKAPDILLRDVGEMVEALFWNDAKARSDLVRNWKKTLDFFGPQCTAKGVTPQSVVQYIDHLKVNEKLKPATINRRLASLSKVLRHAWKNGMIDFVPSIPRQLENNARDYYYKPSDVDRIIAECHAQKWHDGADLFIVLVETGMRLGEALKLRGLDIEEGQALLHDTKSGRPHRVPFPPRSRQIINKRRARLQPGERLFPMTVNSVTHRFTNLKRKLNFPEDACVHTFRHTFASWLVSSGIPIEVVSKRLNHSRLETTMRYAKFSPIQNGQIDSVFERFNKAGDAALLGASR